MVVYGQRGGYTVWATILGSLIIASAIKSIRFSRTHSGNPELRRIASAVTKGDEKGFRFATLPKTSGQRNFDSSLPVSPPATRPFISPIDHRLGFAPRFYRSSDPSRYFCQLYHRLSPGALVTRKQPGDIIRACPRKSIHSDPGEFSHIRARRSRSEIRYWRTILVSDFNFEYVQAKSEVSPSFEDPCAIISDCETG